MDGDGGDGGRLRLFGCFCPAAATDEGGGWWTWAGIFWVACIYGGAGGRSGAALGRPRGEFGALHWHGLSRAKDFACAVRRNGQLSFIGRVEPRLWIQGLSYGFLGSAIQVDEPLLIKP